ncbi:MAG: hypothetical protein EOO77_26330 [Oxalobacteraceae bacterium]|nr:MAG: hypothetical protein EOO77_26330 [Oxalobacteraceae bacterium]
MTVKLRPRKLRNWVNIAIETVVLPELERREKEDNRIWRADQQRLKSSGKHVELDREYSQRVARFHTKESEIRRIFGDIGTGTKTAGTQVSELGKQGARAAQSRANRIAELLLESDEEMLWELRKLQKKCLERMQTSWHSLLDHCTMQITLVKERGKKAPPPFTSIYGGGGHGSMANGATQRQDIMRALMDFEAQNMQHAVADLLVTFERSVLYKPTEFPPLTSFYKTFAPMTGSALRAAREVTCSEGLLYDNAFLSQNNLDVFAEAFYLSMKDHLTLLMVDIQLKATEWKRDRMMRVRRASESVMPAINLAKAPLRRCETQRE